MPTYAAVLGNNPQISLAELAAVLPGFSLETLCFGQVALFATSEPLKQEHLETLGGTLFLAEAFPGKSYGFADFPKLLVEQFSAVKRGKVTFSLRTYGLSKQDAKNAYRNCKDALKKAEHPCRYVGNESKAVQAVVLHEEDMLTGKYGCELFIIQREKTPLWIGKTIAAHDVNTYTKRDIGKPVRDTVVGLLPPKLAQVLLNLGTYAVRTANPARLAGKKPEPLTVLDPFCGTGVIPMECLLRGSPVLACDLSAKAVGDCEKNLEWLRKEKKIAKKDVPSTVWKHDARKPFELKTKPDVLVTETTLGPGLKERPTVKEIQALRKENEALQAAFLKNVHECFPGVPVVCTWPVWYGSKGPLPLESIWKELPKLGFKAMLPTGITSALPDHPTLLYRREGQIVGRQIVVLIPL